MLIIKWIVTGLLWTTKPISHYDTPNKDGKVKRKQNRSVRWQVRDKSWFEHYFLIYFIVISEYRLNNRRQLAKRLSDLFDSHGLLSLSEWMNGWKNGVCHANSFCTTFVTTNKTLSFNSILVFSNVCCLLMWLMHSDSGFPLLGICSVITAILVLASNQLQDIYLYQIHTFSIKSWTSCNVVQYASFGQLNYVNGGPFEWECDHRNGFFWMLLSFSK